VLDLARKAMLMGIGALSMTKEAIEKAVEELVKKGELSQQEGKRLAEELIERGRKERAQIQDAIEKAAAKMIAESGLATKLDLQRLDERLAALEEQAKSH